MTYLIAVRSRQRRLLRWLLLGSGTVDPIVEATRDVLVVR